MKQATRTPAWILCRNLDEYPIPDEATLLAWTRQGRVRPDDYLVDPRQDTCVQARDLHALAPVFRGTGAGRAGAVAGRFAVLSLAVIWVAPAAGSVALLASVIAALAHMVEKS